MHQLYPNSARLELDDLYLDLELSSSQRPSTLAVGMVATIDGAIALDGRSGGIGGAADRMAFRRLRDAADVIVVGAGTVRVEGYRPPRLDEQRTERRRNAGREDRPGLVIVSRDLSLTPDLAVFADEESRPVIATTRHARSDRRRELADVAELLDVGDDDVDLERLRRTLEERGANAIVAEGGARLNGALVAADLVDEWFVTIGNLAVGGSAPRIAVGEGVGLPRAVTLVSVFEHDGELLLRYRRTGDDASD